MEGMLGSCGSWSQEHENVHISKVFHRGSSGSQGLMGWWNLSEVYCMRTKHLISNGGRIYDGAH